MSIFSFIRRKGPGGEERRKFIRLEAHHLLKYKVLQKEEKLSFVKNISAGGICFFTKEEPR